MKKELISIIVPIYKVEKYLNQCISSIVNQTYKNIEIILVDDGSPDNCPKICDEWAKKDARIKVIHKNNGGLSDARNYGIDSATGDYLMFVDSDDYVSEEICEKLLSLIKKHNADVAMSETTTFHENEQVKKFDGKIVIREVKNEELLGELFHSPYIYFVTAWAKLYKKEVFKDLRYPVGKLHEDVFVIHKIIANINTLVQTSEPLYYYLLRESSIIGSYGLKNFQHTKQAYDEQYDYLIKKFPEKTKEITLWHMGMLRCLYCKDKKEYNPVRKEILEEYNRLYKTVKSKGLKNFIFRYFRGLYVFLYKLMR